MKNEISTLSITLGITAIAVYLLSRSHPTISADALAGFGVVLMLLAMAALEYRISWKSLTGR
jgi:hypothetical protein